MDFQHPDSTWTFVSEADHDDECETPKRRAQIDPRYSALFHRGAGDWLDPRAPRRHEPWTFGTVALRISGYLESIDPKDDTTLWVQSGPPI